MTKWLLAVSLLLPAAAHADTKYNQARLAFSAAKMGEQNFECCYQRAVDEQKVKVKKCLDEIDAVLAAGAAPTEDIGTEKKTLGKARQFCAESAKRISIKYVTGRVQYYATWPEAMKQKGKGLDDAKHAVVEADVCRQEIDNATAAGIETATEIKLKDGTTLTLADAKAKICDAVAAAGQVVVDAEQAKVDAKKAPYRKLLTGDKLNLIENLWGDAWYGVGGDRLDTPEKLNAAAAWFGVVTWTDDADGRTHWLLRKYSFRGNKAIGNATERKGCCDSPSSREYR